MATISQQKGFDDQPINDDELRAAVESYLEHKEAAKAYRKADDTIKDRLPKVEEPTRFWLGEEIAIEVTPQSVDGYSVEPRRQQRKRVRTGVSRQEV